MTQERIIQRHEGTIHVTEPDGVERFYNLEDDSAHAVFGLHVVHVHPDGDRMVMEISVDDDRPRRSLIYVPSPKRNLPYSQVTMYFGMEKDEVTAQLRSNAKRSSSEADIKQIIRDVKPDEMLFTFAPGHPRPTGAPEEMTYLRVPKKWEGKKLAAAMPYTSRHKHFEPADEMLAIIKSPPKKTLLQTAQKFGFTFKDDKLETAPANDLDFIGEINALWCNTNGFAGYATHFEHLLRDVNRLTTDTVTVSNKLEDGQTSQQLQQAAQLMASHSMDMEPTAQQAMDCMEKLPAAVNQLEAAVSRLRDQVNFMQGFDVRGKFTDHLRKKRGLSDGKDRSPG